MCEGPRCSIVGSIPRRPSDRNGWVGATGGVIPMLLAGLLPTQARRFPSHSISHPIDAPPESGFYATKRAVVAAFEREYFVALARRCQGNVSEMARQSAMKRHHVRAFLRKHGIDRHSL
jgi:DNA-binding NtrC family response regulator